MPSVHPARFAPFALLLLSLGALALSAHAFLGTTPSDYPAYDRPEDLLRGETLRETSVYGSGYEVALRRTSREEAERSFRIERVAQQDGLALGFVSYRLEGREQRECYWMKRLGEKWYSDYVADYKKGSIPAAHTDWFARVSAEASAWIDAANTPANDPGQTTGGASSS